MHTKYSRTRNSFVATAGSFPDRKTLLFLLAVLVPMLTTVACGGAYPYSTTNPKPKSSVQVFVTANSQQIDVVGSTLLLHAAEQFQSASGEITYNDVTNAADWSASDSAVATVDKGVVTGTGIGHTTISATFGGLSDRLQIFVGMTGHITISPEGPFSLLAAQSVSFQAIETFSDGSRLDVSGPAFWNSTSARVVNLYPYLGGDATLVSTGTTTITATLDTGEVGTLDVTIDP